MSNYVQCNICQKWYTNQRGLLIHLGYCRERHNASEENVSNHHFVQHNPLKSCYDQGEHLNPFAVYDGEFENSSISEEEPHDDFDLNNAKGKISVSVASQKNISPKGNSTKELSIELVFS